MGSARIVVDRPGGVGKMRGLCVRHAARKLNLNGVSSDDRQRSTIKTADDAQGARGVYVSVSRPK